MNSQASARPPLTSVGKIAERLGVSRATVYRWAKDGELPHYRVGDVLRFDPHEIERWLQRRRVGPEPAREAPPTGEPVRPAAERK
ncbi:MAG: helix-turn-helix domain-containing protein [Planctomycetota bacterium]